MPAGAKALGPGSAWRYVTGYVLSLVLTLSAYLIVRQYNDAQPATVSSNIVLLTLAALGITQLAAQLIFFLHLGSEPKPRRNLLVFGFMLMVVIMLVGGSLWIMYNLNYHMTPRQTEQYLIDQGSGGL